MEKREIKFRAWAVHLNEMLPNVQNHINDKDWAFGSILKDDRFKMMQYTGLKDKNGKEIYEGDIVKIEWKNIELDHGKYGDLTEIRLVEYKSAAFWLKDIPLYVHADVDEDNDIPSCEIIGNIYENPELLNKKD